LAKKLNIHIDNAYKIIDILISTGILKEISGGKRNTFYLANEITNILDEVASISSIRRIIQK
jgi:ribosomal protein S25